jgi:glycosyltransferase involved in cell wall biosynthesis
LGGKVLSQALNPGAFEQQHMRILLLQDYLRCGGTERQTVSLCENFCRSGHDVSLLTFRPGGSLSNWARDTGIRLRSLQPFDSQINVFAPGLFRQVRRLNPDVVLCMGRVANSYAGFLKNRFKSIVIVGSARTGKRLPFLNQWSHKQVDAVLANCEWWRKQLVARGVAEQRIKIVHNGLTWSNEHREKSRLRQQIRQELQAGSSTVVFLNVANCRTRKRHPWLLETFALVNPTMDCQLWLVGGGVGWSRCRRIAESSNVAHKIRLLGHQRDPYPYYAGADVALSASLEDSLPNFLIEAQSMGLPVVASDVRGVGETFSNGEGGFLVPPYERFEFLSRIETLCDDTEMRKAMGEFGALSAKRLFSGADQAAKVMCVLKELVHERQTSS